jgi:hypothetical protein
MTATPGTLLHVKGGGALGRQYGLWHALEALGYRFVHPRYTKVPTEFTAASAEVLNRDFAPEVKKRRGLHLHTLHPIETLYDFWLPGDENLDGGKRAIDFVIKNRGNYVQWAALDDIVKSAPQRARVAAAHPGADRLRARARRAHRHRVAVVRSEQPAERVRSHRRYDG